MSAQPNPFHPVLRPLVEADLDAVFEIEISAYPFPWTRGIFSECLRVGYGCYGLQAGPDLAGYAIHNWAAGESHLLNLCVSPDWQRRGFGSILLDHAIDHARVCGAEVMFLEVRPSNPGAIALYERRGFTEIGRRPAYYRAGDGREDAVVMRLPLVAGP
ncbi:ribosomal-protein-alanine N-acetyltransferase [Marinihelvus fidelis]|uniref:[Ribosomal protein bS18]-alanine N-acetyltransferase n=1 Tax=Marinihelvus fidelis TaxID=2613842 RepID=A0A5N0T7C3_9GAMM|nr:ribosomal protein S18-alanine N-acetyltransferase [Marinihelvus fidelis]KAA9130792.1 ribosomal-protein-alanine N-acetyltransferase [Marinihelvus fidelis]